MVTALLGESAVYAPDLKQNGNLEERVRRASRGAEPLRCRCCGAGLHFHGGPVLSWHFKHSPGSDQSCQLTEGDYESESTRHRRFKEAVVQWLRDRYDETWVKPEGYVEEIGRFADVLLSLPSGASAEGEARRVAFEIQCSPISGLTWAERSADYEEAGVQDVWLLAGPASMNHLGAGSTPVQAAGDRSAEKLTAEQRSFWLQDPLAGEWDARPAAEKGEVWKAGPLSEKILQTRGQVFLAEASSETGENKQGTDPEGSGAAEAQGLQVTALLAAATPYPASISEGPEERVQALKDLPFERQPPRVSRYRPFAEAEPDAGKRVFPERTVFRAPLRECSVRPSAKGQAPPSREDASGGNRPGQSGPRVSSALFVLSGRHERTAERALRWERAALQWKTGWEERRAAWEKDQKRRREEKRRAERKRRLRKYVAAGSILLEEMPALLDAFVALRRESTSWSARRLQNSSALPKKEVRGEQTKRWTPLTGFSLPLDWIFGCPPRLWQMVAYCYEMYHHCAKQYSDERSDRYRSLGAGMALKAIKRKRLFEPSEKIENLFDRVSERLRSETDGWKGGINFHALRQTLVHAYYERLCKSGRFLHRDDAAWPLLGSEHYPRSVEDLLRLARHSLRSAWLYHRSRGQSTDAQADKTVRAKIGQRWAFLARHFEELSEISYFTDYALKLPFFKPCFDVKEVGAVRRALAAGTLRTTEYGFASKGKPLHEITWKVKKDGAGEWWSRDGFSVPWP